jgi:hypothetical protein
MSRVLGPTLLFATDLGRLELTLGLLGSTWADLSRLGSIWADLGIPTLNAIS